MESTEVRDKQLNVRVSRHVHTLFVKMCKMQGKSAPDMITSLVIQASLGEGMSAVLETDKPIEVEESIADESNLMTITGEFLPALTPLIMVKYTNGVEVWNTEAERQIDELMASKKVSPIEGARELLDAIAGLYRRHKVPMNIHASLSNMVKVLEAYYARKQAKAQGLI